MKMILMKPDDGLPLIEALELAKLRGNEFKNLHDADRHKLEEMHRSFHLRVVNWLHENGFEVVRP